MIELLVVIAIVGVLASLLLPGLSEAKAAAQSAKCKSNLRQMGVGLQLYVHDNRGEFPFTMVWDLALGKYLTAKASLLDRDYELRCPSGKVEGPGIVRMSNNTVFQTTSVYGYNGAGAGLPRSGEGPVGLGGIPGNGDMVGFSGGRSV